MQKPNLLALAALSLSIFSLALAAPLVPAFAQTTPPPPPMHSPHGGGGRLKKLADELGLTDAQKAQMKPILMSARQQAQAIKKDSTLTPDARTAKLKALRKSTRQQTMAVLTPDQRAKLKSIRQAKREAKEGVPEAN
jgi:Spy/CpxP family protein refolding chaperone